jgi:hypothetical protein
VRLSRRIAGASLALVAVAVTGGPTTHRIESPPVTGERACSPAVCPPQFGSGIDRDQDRIADSAEQALAEAYAPIVWHAPDEPNLPTSVDSFLAHTRLAYFDVACGIDSILASVLRSQHALVEHSVTIPCAGGDLAHSAGTRSERKQRTFYLADVTPPHRGGNAASTGWITYYHAYPNDLGGVTVQYWRFYSFNTGLTYSIGGARFEVGHHGGDWEGVHVVLGPALQPVAARFVGHDRIVERPWPDVHHAGEHLMIASEPGRHSSMPDLELDTTKAVRQETWSRGTVRWRGGRTSRAGALINLGEKTVPFAPFVAYSGLWGSPGQCLPAIGCINSGYWGPAYNETGMRDDGFITAWCAGMADSARSLGGQWECYPAAVSP